MKNFKEINKTDKALLGIWLNSDSIVSAEISGHCGFDWAVVDWEHGMSSFNGILNKVRALSTSETAPVIRVPANDPVYIKKGLDMGASGIMVPNINNAAEAKIAVSAMQYPPEGTRGMASSCRAADYGYGFKEYFKKINSGLVKAVQIETAEATANIDAIAAVDGVDMLFIGHSDLSASLDIYGDFKNERILKIENDLISACKKYNKQAGLIVRDSDKITSLIEKGFRYIIIATDTGLLKQGMKNALKAATLPARTNHDAS